MKKPLIVGIFHGILTGVSDSAWSGACSRFLLSHSGDERPVITISRDYYEFPFPRFAALRNSERSREIASYITSRITGIEFREKTTPDIALIGHSNGCVLSMQSARAIIASGRSINTLILLSPALRTVEATQEITEWINRGKLGSAVLVMAGQDKLLSWAAFLPRFITWPWGSLGVDGWSLDHTSLLSASRMTTIAMPDEGHNTYLHDTSKQRGIFENIISPALGLP